MSEYRRFNINPRELGARLLADMDDRLSIAALHTIDPRGAIAKVNADIQANGTAWQKCPNCGGLYVFGDEANWPGNNSTLCSENCAREYTDYVMGRSL